MEAALNSVVGAINTVLWNYVLIVLLIGAGIWFSVRTNFVQLRMLPEMVRLLGEGVGSKAKENHITSFQAFCVSTASRVGVGNIAGVAIAVVLGGPGAIFWMWVIAFLGSATGFIESTLAQIYKEPLPKGGFHGGPAYYIRNGLNSPAVAVFFAILISITFGLIYNSVQANTISASMATFNIPAEVTAAVIAILTGLVIFGGMTRIAKVSEWLVPIMASLYILVAIFIVVVNITELPHVIALIFSTAFDPTAFGGGFMGAAMMNGIKRGLFSNEAGEGSVPNAAATADVSHPVKQGLIQGFGVFVDTMLVCTSTAFIVLISGNYSDSGKTGVALVQHDLASQLGSWAPDVMALFIFMFAFSSIVGNYYYGEINISHLTKNRIYLNIFRAAVVAMVFLGSIASLDLVWNMADLFMALMAFTNLISILLLAKQALAALRDYRAQKRAGIADPTFYKTSLPDQHGIAWWDQKDV